MKILHIPSFKLKEILILNLILGIIHNFSSVILFKKIIQGYHTIILSIQSEMRKGLREETGAHKSCREGLLVGG